MPRSQVNNAFTQRLFAPNQGVSPVAPRTVVSEKMKFAVGPRGPGYPLQVLALRDCGLSASIPHAGSAAAAGQSRELAAIHWNLSFNRWKFSADYRHLPSTHWKSSAIRWNFSSVHCNLPSNRWKFLADCWLLPSMHRKLPSIWWKLVARCRKSSAIRWKFPSMRRKRFFDMLETSFYLLEMSKYSIKTSSCLLINWLE